ncbi:hypothetical protein N431DRAFT_437446 [Stipitochalara longipes BDJ]|nr:hypothetical protein N431DRAFT_437446 [Stipitochalara longipes BDJ]
MGGSVVGNDFGYTTVSRGNFDYGEPNASDGYANKSGFYGFLLGHSRVSLVPSERLAGGTGAYWDALDKSTSWDKSITEDEGYTSQSATNEQHTLRPGLFTYRQRECFGSDKSSEGDTSTVENWDSSFGDDSTLVGDEEDEYSREAPGKPCFLAPLPRTPGPHGSFKFDREANISKWVSKQRVLRMVKGNTRRPCEVVQSRIKVHSSKEERQDHSEQNHDRPSHGRNNAVVEYQGFIEKIFERQLECSKANQYEELLRTPAPLVLEDESNKLPSRRPKPPHEPGSVSIRHHNLQTSGHRPRIRCSPACASFPPTSFSNKRTSPERRKGHVREKKQKLEHHRHLPIRQLYDVSESTAKLQNLPHTSRRQIKIKLKLKSRSTRSSSSNIKDFRLRPNRLERPIEEDCWPRSLLEHSSARIPQTNGRLCSHHPPSFHSNTKMHHKLNAVSKLIGCEHVKTSIPNSSSPSSIATYRHDHISKEQVLMESWKRPSGAAAHCFYDAVRDQYIEKSLLDGPKQGGSPLLPIAVEGFPRFIKFPPEVRMQIFEYAVLDWGPNNVYISCHQRRAVMDPLFELSSSWKLEQDPTKTTPSRKIPNGWLYELRARYQIHPLLHTNYEARVVARKFYKPSFGHQLSHLRGVWFDSTQDTLIMESGGAFDFFKYGVWNTEEDRSEQKKVEKALRYLGIRALTPNEVVAMGDYGHSFQNLEKLYLERNLDLGPDIESYEEYFFGRMEGELKDRWEEAKERGEIEAVPEIHTLHSQDFEDALRYDTEDIEETELTPIVTTQHMKIERRIAKLEYLYGLQALLATLSLDNLNSKGEFWEPKMSYWAGGIR